MAASGRQIQLRATGLLELPCTLQRATTSVLLNLRLLSLPSVCAHLSLISCSLHRRQ